MFGKGTLVRSKKSEIICLVVQVDHRYGKNVHTLQVVKEDESFTEFPVGTKYVVQESVMEKCYCVAN